MIAHHNVVWGMEDGLRSNRPGHFHIVYNNTIIPDINNKWGPWPGKRDQAGIVIVNNVYRDTLMAKEDVYLNNNLKKEFRITSPDQIPAFEGSSDIPGFPSYIGAVSDGEEMFSFGHDFENPPEVNYEPQLPRVRNYLKNGCFDYLTTYSERFTAREIEDGALPHWDPIRAGKARSEYYEGFNFPENPEHRFSIHGHSLRLDGEAPDGVVQVVKGLEPNTNYSFMAFLKTRGEAEVTFTLKTGKQVLAAVGSAKVDYEGESNWKYIHIRFKTGTAQDELDLEIVNQGPGTAYIDDAGIIPVI
jgi:hypothetical protein